MVNERICPRYRRGGRFFGRRVNCERVPALPAEVVRCVLGDPRNIPYLLAWKSEQDGEIKEAVRVIRFTPSPWLSGLEFVEVKRTDGSVSHIRAIKWSVPRNGGYGILLSCPFCSSPRRALYGWEPGGRYTSSVQTCSWRCRTCAGLRYASEGGALVLRSRFAMLRPLSGLSSPRPGPWYPYVFSSPADAVSAGFGKNDEC